MRLLQIIKSYLFSSTWTNNTECTNPNGTITLNPSNDGPFTYSWTGGLNSRTGLSAGDYAVTITGGNGDTVITVASYISFIE